MARKPKDRVLQFFVASLVIHGMLFGGLYLALANKETIVDISEINLLTDGPGGTGGAPAGPVGDPGPAPGKPIPAPPAPPVEKPAPPPPPPPPPEPPKPVPPPPPPPAPEVKEPDPEKVVDPDMEKEKLAEAIKKALVDSQKQLDQEKKKPTPTPVQVAAIGPTSTPSHMVSMITPKPTKPVLPTAAATEEAGKGKGTQVADAPGAIATALPGTGSKEAAAGGENAKAGAAEGKGLNLEAESGSGTGGGGNGTNKGGTGWGGGPGGGGFPYAWYLRMLKNKIESNLQLPVNAATVPNPEVKFRFVVLRSGELASVEIVTGSGLQAVDDATVDAVKRAAPFQQLPSGMQGSQLP